MPFDQQNFEPTPTDPILVALTGGRAKIAHPRNWHKGCLLRDIRGDRTSNTDEAVSACSWGSLIWAVGHTEAKESALLLLAAHSGRRCVGIFNDDPKTTHADVLALFDRAIAARKADLLKTNEVGAVASNASA